MATRTTRRSGGGPDAVAILALLKCSDGETETLLVTQFRPPVKTTTIELPAGLIDADESPEAAALREYDDNVMP